MFVQQISMFFYSICVLFFFLFVRHNCGKVSKHANVIVDCIVIAT